MTDPSKATPYPYAYPPSEHIRKHGPDGYADYSSYRDWLRDEFSFRCVYCLFREQWPRELKSNWDIDHFTPQAVAASLTLTYDNLLYVCATCNSLKSSDYVPDPCAVAVASSLQVDASGRIRALTKEAEIMVGILRLDSQDRTRVRNQMIRTINLAAENDRDLYSEFMGYPRELPDLSKLKPPRNTRKDGINNSFFARRERGELEDVY